MHDVEHNLGRSFVEHCRAQLFEIDVATLVSINAAEDSHHIFALNVRKMFTTSSRLYIPKYSCRMIAVSERMRCFFAVVSTFLSDDFRVLSPGDDGRPADILLLVANIGFCASAKGTSDTRDS